AGGFGAGDFRLLGSGESVRKLAVVSADAGGFFLPAEIGFAVGGAGGGGEDDFSGFRAAGAAGGGAVFPEAGGGWGGAASGVDDESGWNVGGNGGAEFARVVLLVVFGGSA